MTESTPRRQDLSDRIDKMTESLEEQGIRWLVYPREGLDDPDLFEATAKHQSIIDTTGIPLARDPSWVDRLKEKGVSQLSISLHGTRAAHCWLAACSAETFDEIVRGIRVAVDAGIDVDLMTVVGTRNAEDVVTEFPAMVVDLGVTKWRIQRLLPTGRAKSMDVSEFLTGEAAGDFVRRVGVLRRDQRLSDVRVEFDITWGPNFYSYGIYKYLSTEVEGWPPVSPFPCPSVSGHFMVVSADSEKTYPCFLTSNLGDNEVGTFESGKDPFAENPYTEAAAQEKLKSPCSASACSYFHLCMGGCRSVATAFGRLKGDSDPWAPMDFCITHYLETSGVDELS